MSRTGSEELTPLHVAAARGCRRCIGLLLRERGHLRDQDGKQAMDLVLEQGWPLVDDLGRPRRALSFLTEDDTDGSISSGFPEDDSEAGPLSSTRRSFLEDLELGGCCVPPVWQNCPPEPPWPQGDPRGSALPPQPLASSTLLSDRDEFQEGPLSGVGRGRTGGSPWASSKLSVGDIPAPSPHFGPSGSLRLPQQCTRILGGHRAAVPRGGLSSCFVPCQSSGDSDILSAAAQHRPGVPWGGVGSADPKMGVMVPKLGAGSCDPTTLGDSSSSPGDPDSPGDSSSATECFVSALETLEASEAGGCWEAQPRCSPPPRAAGGLGWGAAPSPGGTAPWQLPLTRPPSSEQARGEDFGGGSGAAPCCEGVPGVGDVGELLMQFEGCSLRGSPPCTPQSVCTPASVAAGDVTPRSQEAPGHPHVTPRTRSRLRAAAKRLSSSSSSLFDGTLPMPRRPPRIRSPRGVPKDPPTPSGHCVTPRCGDVSSEDGDGTGSLDDTQTLPGAPSSPLEGSGSSPGSSPTILLLPGDQRHPHNSPGSSPTVLLVAGDQGPPQNPSSGLWGSPHPGVLEGGSGWQRPSPLGTPQFHRSFRHLLVPQPPNSPEGELETPTVPPSSAGCGTHNSEGHQDDKEQGESPLKCPSPSAEATTSPDDTTGQDGRVPTVSPRPLSDQSLRRRLRELGEDPGPVTEFTRRLYLRRLHKLARGPPGGPEGHSPELVAAVRTGHIPDCAQDELALARQFERPDRSRHWREGLLKSSFNYLLLDPRTTQNLPLRSPGLSPAERFRTFVTAVFYVGKGTRARPYCHLAEALGQHRAGTRQGCPKVQRILEIWESGHGVISVLCFQNRVPAEAYTRESCMVEALGLQTLTNQRKGHCYGVAAGWAAERRRRLGVHMLYRAMNIFLAEGERQLRPRDIPGGC